MLLESFVTYVVYLAIVSVSLSVISFGDVDRNDDDGGSESLQIFSCHRGGPFVCSFLSGIMIHCHSNSEACSNSSLSCDWLRIDITLKNGRCQEFPLTTFSSI